MERDRTRMAVVIALFLVLLPDKSHASDQHFEHCKQTQATFYKRICWRRRMTLLKECLRVNGANHPTTHILSHPTILFVLYFLLWHDEQVR